MFDYIEFWSIYQIETKPEVLQIFDVNFVRIHSVRDLDFLHFLTEDLISYLSSTNFMSKGVSFPVAIDVRNSPLTYLLNENLKSYDIVVFIKVLM